MGVWGYGRIGIFDFRFSILDWIGVFKTIRNPQSTIHYPNPPTLPHPHTPTQRAVVRKRQKRRLSFILLLACLTVLLSGCDETITPIVGEERPFTLWGFLDANADTQRVRVFTIEERLGLDRAGPIDAVVTSVDLDTGERRQWTDQEVTFSDGSVGHVFWSPFRAEFEHRYRLEVARSDGAVSSVEVTIPPSVEVELIGATERTIFPAFIRGTPPNLIRIEVEYDAATLPPLNPWPPGSPTPLAHRYSVAVSYDGKQEPTEDGWMIEINMREDFAVVQDEFERNCLPRDLIALRRIDFRFLAANEEWTPPGGSFDLDLLIEPGTFSNVENGFGFFGGGYTVSTRWFPNLDVLASIGFKTAGPCLLTPQNIPECQIPPEPCFRDE